MFRTEKRWVRVYEGQASPETEVYEGSLTDFFRSSAEEYRDKTAITFYGTTFDFARLEALSEKMAVYKTVEFRDELPKSTVGKLLRRVLAGEEKAKASTKAVSPQSSG